jgi:hypothetical protein
MVSTISRLSSEIFSSFPRKIPRSRARALNSREPLPPRDNSIIGSGTSELVVDLTMDFSIIAANGNQ